MRLCVTTTIAERFGRRIASLAPGVELVELADDGSFSGEAASVEAFFLSEDLYNKPRAIAAGMGLVQSAALQWFHSSSAGIDHPIFQQVIDGGTTLTHSPGQHAQPIAEYVIGYILHAAKRMAAHAEQQRRREWAPLESLELTGRTLGIVGYGGIGAEVARLAKAFRMRVLALKRTPVDAPDVDEMLTSDRLHALLAASDYVAVTVPLTNESRDMIGAPEFAAMKDGAVLINVARGGVVQEAALVAALKAGRIGGAVLDVAPLEPLPRESELWALPNCVITPHDSGSSPLSLDRTTEHFLKNLARYARGEPLLNVAASTENTGPAASV